MYNVSYISYLLDEQRPITVNVPKREEDLSSIGIFVSSIILSVGGCITMLLAQVQKSKCKTVSCLGLRCVREIEV